MKKMLFFFALLTNFVYGQTAVDRLDITADVWRIEALQGIPYANFEQDHILGILGEVQKSDGTLVFKNKHIYYYVDANDVEPLDLSYNSSEIRGLDAVAIFYELNTERLTSSGSGLYVYMYSLPVTDKKTGKKIDYSGIFIIKIKNEDKQTIDILRVYFATI